jgi:cation:H+ antiporter
MLEFAGVALGILLLLAGGTLVVRGASEIAERLGVSPMIVGLTIVGFGTSAPELVVNVLGAINGETALAFGNVAGSNVANLGVVLGLAALIAPITIQGDLVRREVPLLLLGTTVLTVMALDGPLEGATPLIDRIDSIVLLLLFGVFIYITAMDVIRAQESDKLLLDLAERSSLTTLPKGHLSWIMLAVGGAMLFIGGELTVRNGSSLAEGFGISPAIIGLFVVAVGTSMPELVTSIVAALRGESDLALGNVVGSNIFNALFVLPISGLIAPIPIPDGGIGDLAVSWVFAALLIYFFVVGRARLGRPAGALFVAAYFAYATYRIMAG